MTDRPPRTWPIAVRVGRPEDRDRILEMTRETFEGHDYIPHVIDEWLVPSSGVVIVATVGTVPDGEEPRDASGGALDAGDVIAMTRVTMLSSVDAWLEGIRVDPRVRGMDIATDLQVAELHWIAAHGAHVVRYLANESNIGSLRLGRRHGLDEIGRWRSRMPWPPGGERAGPPADQVRAALAGQPPAQAADWTWVTADPFFAAGHALYEWRSWAFQELTPERFVRHIARGEAVVSRNASGDGSAVAIVNADGGEDGETHVPFAAGDPQALSDLLVRLGRPEVRFPDPLPEARAGLEALLLAAGYSVWPRAGVIVERRIDAEHPIPGIDAARLVLLDAPRPIARPEPL